MIKMILEAVAKPTVMSPSKVLLNFYKILSIKQVNICSGCVEILEEYINETENIINEEKNSRKLAYLQSNKESLLSSYKKYITDEFIELKSISLFNVQATEIWKHIMDSKNGEVGKLVESILHDEYSESIISKLNILKDEDQIYNIIDECHSKIHGENSIPFTVKTLQVVKEYFLELIYSVEDYVNIKLLSESNKTPKNSAPYKKYLDKLLSWVKDRELIMGGESTTVFNTFYAIIKDEIINFAETKLFYENEKNIWDNFFPFNIKADLYAFLILYPETRKVDNLYSIDPMVLINSTVEKRTIGDSFIDHINKDEVSIPYYFLRCNPSFNNEMPDGYNNSYEVILNEAIQNKLEKIRNKSIEQADLFEQIFINYEFSASDYNLFLMGYYQLSVINEFINNKYAIKETLTIDKFEVMYNFIKEKYFSRMDKIEPFSNGIYFNEKLNFYKILSETPKKLEPIVIGKQKIAKKQQNKMLRQFWWQIQQFEDFYPRQKELGFLKELFMDLGYNLLEKKDPEIERFQTGEIYKIIEIKLIPLFTHYVPPMWNNVDLNEHILVIFRGSSITPEDFMETLKNKLENRKEKPLICISISYLDYNFRMDVNHLANKMEMNFLLLDPYLAGYLLLPEITKVRQEAFHYIGAVYSNYNPYDDSQTDGAYELEFLHSFGINELLRLKNSTNSLISKNLKYNLDKKIKSNFDQDNNSIEHSTRYIYRSVINESSILKVIREELGNFGLERDVSDLDLPTKIKALFADNNDLKHDIILFLDDAYPLLQKSFEDDLFDIIIVSRIMDVAKSNLRVIFSGYNIIIHLFDLTNCNKKNQYPLIPGLGIKQYPTAQGFEARNFLLIPLKVLGIIFPSDYPIHILLKRLNYEPYLIKIFAKQLVEYVRNRLPENAYPPYEINNDIIESVMATLSLDKVAKELYLRYLNNNIIFKYILYTIAYLLYSYPFLLGGIDELLLYNQINKLYPGTFDYIDLDEVSIRIYELYCEGYISFYAVAGVSINSYRLITGRQNFLEMIGEVEEVQKEIAILRANKDKLEAPNYTDNRRRILKPIDDLKLPPNPQYYTLNTSNNDIEYDFNSFVERYTKIQNLPSSFTLREELLNINFNSLYRILVLTPLNYNDRSIISLIQWCLLRQITVVKITIDSNDIADKLNFDSMFSSINDFSRSLDKSISSHILFVVDLVKVNPTSQSILTSFTNNIDNYRFRNKQGINFLLCANKDNYLDYKCAPSYDILYNQFKDQKLNSLSDVEFTPNKWTKTSLSIYLKEIDLPVDYTNKILENSQGFDELVMNEIYKLKGKKYKLNEDIYKPLYEGIFGEYVNLYRNAFKEGRSLSEANLRVLVSEICEKTVVSNNYEEIQLIKLCELLMFFGLFNVKSLFNSGDHFFVKSDPLFASGEIFPEK
jgi:hypothetical protein